jgi:anti-sigma B factor antagonist
VAAFYFPPQLPALYDEAGCPALPAGSPARQWRKIGSEDVSIKTSTRLVKNVLIVDTIGELRLGEGTDVIRELVREQLLQGYKNILLNLRDVRHIDSAGVGELMSCYTSVRNQGGQLKLMNLSKNVHNLLQITKLYTIFEVVEDEDKAVASYS